MASHAILRHLILPAPDRLAGYAAIIWVPVYLVRIHGLGTGIVGTYLAPHPGFWGCGGNSFGWTAGRSPVGPARAPVAPLDRRPCESPELAPFAVDLSGPHGAGGAAGLCRPRHAGDGVRGPKLCADSKRGAHTHAGRGGRNKSFHHQYHWAGAWAVQRAFSDVFAASTEEESLRYGLMTGVALLGAWGTICAAGFCLSGEA